MAKTKVVVDLMLTLDAPVKKKDVKTALKTYLENTVVGAGKVEKVTVRNVDID